MKPGERIRLITEAMKSLESRDWSEAQLILDQFGFDTYEWSGFGDFEPRTYFVDQLKKGADGPITEIHTYLMGDDAEPSSQLVSDRPWGIQPVSVFLSHCHEDAKFAGSVKSILNARYGMDAFVAHADIEPSESWRGVIKNALASCHLMVAIIHPGFHASQWCDQEVGWAMGRGIPILPVRHEGVPRRDGFIEEHQDLTIPRASIESTDGWWLARRILDVALADPRTHRLGVRALAEAFAKSVSFDQTRQMWTLIEKEPQIDPEQLRRLEYGVQSNRQVYEAVRKHDGKPIPELVEELVASMEPATARSEYPEAPF